MGIGRREFLESIAAGTAGLTICGGATLAPAESKPPATFDPFGEITLGRTKIKTSLTGLGTGMRGWMRKSDHTRMGLKKFTQLVRGALERGVRWFDLADLYGSQPLFAKAMKSVKRDKYTIVSKIWWKPKGVPDKDRPDADVMVGRFLKELQTDYIDIVQLHCVTSGRWPENLRKQMDLLEKLKKRGVIRAHGVSCHSMKALLAAADEPWTDCVHVRINPYGVRTDGKPEEILTAVRKLHAAGKGVIGMKIIGEGKFGDSDEKKDKSISFALGSGCVDTLLVGFEKLSEIDDFAARVRKIKRPVISART